MCIIGFRWLLWFAFIYNDIHSYILSFELCQYLQYARLSLKFRIHWSEKRIILLQYKKYFNISILRYQRSISILNAIIKEENIEIRESTNTSFSLIVSVIIDAKNRIFHVLKITVLHFTYVLRLLLIRVSLIFYNVDYFCYEYLQIAMFLKISYFIGSLYNTHT